jgi:hypothetical protein
MSETAHTLDFYPPVADAEGMGPAMLKISPQQRAWVMAYLDANDENASGAARRSGYGKDSATPAQAQEAQKRAGYRNVHSEDVLEAIRELAQEKFRISGFKAVAALMEIVKDPTHKDHFKAIERVLAQNGMVAALQVEHNHKHSLDEAQQIEKVVQLARRLGMDPRTLLGTAGVEWVDAEFVDVTDQKVLTGPAEPDMWTVQPEEEF